MASYKQNVDKPIVITAGDPAGIGYDIIAKEWANDALRDCAIIACPNTLAARALSIGVSLDQQDGPELIPLPFNHEVIAGQADAKSAENCIKALDIAIDGCKEKHFSAMVTAPLNKAVINDSGLPFSGHTEYLAERTGAILPVMMLADQSLRVVLVTTHIPISDVPKTITRDLLSTVISITENALRNRFNIAKPKLAVLGLNPHASENGYIGHEDIDTVGPCLENLRADGLDITGPLPACTAFIASNIERFDAFIAMYHDQGLPIIKARGFGETVNITLGLPIIRTSVDHGTAYGIAGSGAADPSSLIAAIKTARLMAS